MKARGSHAACNTSTKAKGGTPEGIQTWGSVGAGCKTSLAKGVTLLQGCPDGSHSLPSRS